MEWMKHDSNAKEDPLISDLITEFGHSGYFFWFGILEEITREMKRDSNRCHVKYRLSDWSRKLRTKWKKLLPFLVRINSEPNCNVVLTDLETGSKLDPTKIELTSNLVPSQIMISVENRKALKLRDTRNLKTKPVGTIDKEKEKEKEKEREEEGKEPPAPPAPSKGPKKAIQRMVPQSWLDARDTGTFPSREKEALLIAAEKYKFGARDAWKLFVFFVNQKESSGKTYADWVAAFRVFCQNVASGAWSGPTGLGINTKKQNYYDPGLEQAEALRKEQMENMKKLRGLNG